MPKKITKDTGMMQRTELVYRMDDPRDLEPLMEHLKAWIDSMPVELPGDWMGDALRRDNADRCRAILATVGLVDDDKCVVNTGPLRALGLAENSAQWIAAHWLAQYNALMRARERVEAGNTTPENLSRMLMATEEMGRLQERLYWRAGVDPEAGERREALAVTGRPVKRGQKEAAEITNRKHRTLREKRFARLAELLPKMSLESAAVRCEAENMGKAGAIVRQWNRHKKMSDT